MKLYSVALFIPLACHMVICTLIHSHCARPVSGAAEVRHEGDQFLPLSGTTQLMRPTPHPLRSSWAPKWQQGDLTPTQRCVRTNMFPTRSIVVVACYVSVCMSMWLCIKHCCYWVLVCKDERVQRNCFVGLAVYRLVKTLVFCMYLMGHFVCINSSLFPHISYCIYVRTYMRKYPTNMHP